MNTADSDAFNQSLRRCGLVFAAVVCATLAMVAVSYAPLANRRLATGLILLGASFNASLVAGYLMHLISERKTIYALLAFTAVFFAGLMGLTVWAHVDLPGMHHALN